MWKQLTTALTAMAALVAARPVNEQTRTLVVVDQSVDKALYNPVFDSLKQREHELDIKDVHDEFDLLNFDELNYDNLLVLPASKTRALGNRLSGKRLLQFFNLGGNILSITGPSAVPESIREFAAELDIFISPKGYKLTDHFSASGASHDKFKLEDDKHNVAPESVSSTGIDGIHVESSSAAYLGNSELVIPLIHADATSYTYDSRDEMDEVVKAPWVVGTQSYLAAGLQANNNARFLWLGCQDLLLNSDKLQQDYTKWVFQEKSVIRPVDSQHHLQGSDRLNERLYKVNEPMHYEIELQEWDGSQWVPYQANDVQLEFTMLDPYYRLTMNHTVDVGKNVEVYTADFKLPDQYGMFTFRVAYRRAGISFIDYQDVVTIRHIANNEWPRSWEITNSWVYLTSAVSVVVAWVIFITLYLYSPADVTSRKKNQ